MELLVITDIPRMTALFERVALVCPGLTLVNDIHRGIEDLDRRRPDLVIFQNRLSGLSADILHKHLKSRLGGRKTRSNSAVIRGMSVITSSSMAAPQKWAHTTL
jgi:hypothetical protein